MPQFKCKACNRSFKWRAEIAGKKVKCKCGEILRVPTGKSASGAPKPATSIPKPAAPPAEPDSMVELNALASMEAEDETGPMELNIPDPPRTPRAAPQPASANAPAIALPASSSGDGLIKRWLVGFKLALYAGDPDVAKTREQFVCGIILTLMLFVGLGTGALIWSNYLTSDAEAFQSVAKTAEATITGTPKINRGGKRSRNKPDRWSFETPVRYSVAGNEFNSKVKLIASDLPSGVQLPGDPFEVQAYEAWVGKSVEILYHPENLDDTRTQAEVDKASFFAVFLFWAGIVFFVWGGWELFKDFREMG